MIVRAGQNKTGNGVLTFCKLYQCYLCVFFSMHCSDITLNAGGLLVSAEGCCSFSVVLLFSAESWFMLSATFGVGLKSRHIRSISSGSR